MRKQYVLVALFSVTILTSVAAAYALTWYRIRAFNNRYIGSEAFHCYNMPSDYTPLRHRFRLIPLDNDVDLYVYGYSGNSWHLIGSSNLSDLFREQVLITQATRSRYSTLRACAYGYDGASYFHLRYDGGY
jgi:hypothetical protein